MSIISDSPDVRREVERLRSEREMLLGELALLRAERDVANTLCQFGIRQHEAQEKIIAELRAELAEAREYSDKQHSAIVRDTLEISELHAELTRYQDSDRQKTSEINILTQENRKVYVERNTAWSEAHEIRSAIRANPEESTADEVRWVVSERDAAKVSLENLEYENKALAHLHAKAVAERDKWHKSSDEFFEIVQATQSERELKAGRDALRAEVETLKGELDIAGDAYRAKHHTVTELARINRELLDDRDALRARLQAVTDALRWLKALTFEDEMRVWPDENTRHMVEAALAGSETK